MWMGGARELRRAVRCNVRAIRDTATAPDRMGQTRRGPVSWSGAKEAREQLVAWDRSPQARLGRREWRIAPVLGTPLTVRR